MLDTVISRNVIAFAPPLSSSPIISMKIFAKRKRKSIDDGPSSKTTSDATGSPKSDRVVEELLKKDPASWNSKERRMVKRYQERQPTARNGVGSETPNDTISESQAKSEMSSLQKEENVNDSDEKDFDQQEEARQNEHTSAQGEIIVKEKKHVGKDNLHSILEKLTSKQRRKLTRQLERDGDAEKIRHEAVALLEEKKEADKDSKNPALLETKSLSKPDRTEPRKCSRKRRKKIVDLSTLTPEERLRREEQRRLQKEAAERRKNENSDGIQKHRHPLNSERRRANRRKPKWKPKSTQSGGEYNEHDTSGYQMRRARQF